MKSFVALGLFLLISHTAISQKWQQMINEGANYYETIKEAERYFVNEGAADKRNFKFYMRWKEDMSYQVGKDGIVKNFNSLSAKAYKKLIRSGVSQTRSTNGNWNEIGPFDYTTTTSSQGGIGRINRITIDPNNINTLWIGAPAGGLWKSIDAGSSWTPYSAGLGPTGISGIVIDPTNSNVMYMLTGDGDRLYTRSIGVIKSTDGGQNWNKTDLDFEYMSDGQAFPPERLYKIIMHPTDPLTLYVCGIGGIWKTIDGGANFAQIYTAAVYDLEFAPDNPDIVYGGRFSSIIKKGFSDFSWNVVYSQAGGSTRVELAVTPASPGSVYGLLGGGSLGFDGLVKSSNYGSAGSFQLKSNSPNILSNTTDGSTNGNQVNSGNIELIVDPSDASIVYVAGINVWKSVDTGATWTRKTYWDENNPPYVHADFIDLVFQGSNLYAVNDGGVYRTSDGGNTWTDLTVGMSLATFYDIDVKGAKYIGGTQDNGAFSGSVTNQLGTHLTGGDGFAAAYYSASSNIKFFSNQNQILRQEGTDVDDISPFGLGANDFWNAEIDVHTSDPDTIFVTSNRQLFRGTGDSTTFSWDSLETESILTNAIREFVQGVDNSNYMYVTSSSLVLKSTNINASPPSWIPLNITFITSGKPSDVEVDPSDATHLWIGLDGYENGEKIYFSDDGGSSWENISGSLPNIPVNSLEFQPGSNDGIYVGTKLGIFYRDADMSDWVYYSNGLPPIQINDLVIDGSYLYAGTFGRGIWRSPFYSTCAPSLTLTPANDPSTPYTIGKRMHHASNFIASTRIIEGGVGTEVYYHAGSYVDMIPGFWAKKGNKYQANIEGCPD